MREGEGGKGGGRAAARRSLLSPVEGVVWTCVLCVSRQIAGDRLSSSTAFCSLGIVNENFCSRVTVR